MYIDEIKERMSLLKDERLMTIVTEEFEDYEPEAVEIAKKILQDRGIDYHDAKPKNDAKITENNENSSIPVYYELNESSGGYESID